MTRKIRFFLLALISVVVPAAFAAGPGPISLVSKGPRKTYVVAVGINVYEDRHIPRLYAPQTDATKLFSVLTGSPTGLATTKDSSILLLGSGATKASILEAIKNRMALLEPDDELIIYFSGISTASQSGDEVFLYPYDGKVDTVDTSAIALDGDILSHSPKGSDLIFIGDGCQIGAGFTEGINKSNPRIGVLSASKFDENAIESPGGTPFSRGLVSVLLSATGDLDGDGFISLEEAFVGLYPEVVSASFSQQHPTIAGARVHRLMLVRAPLLMNTIEFDSALPNDILTGDDLRINGKELKIDRARSDPEKLVLLGDTNGVIGRGLTYLETTKHQYLYWRESEKLQNFQNPYKSSYAVLVAIDDYDRTHDPLHRGKTGYEPRGFMVQGAENLHKTLIHLGFDEKNVITLYNERATSDQIEKTLQTFWKGGEHESADRVVFYFGGHGDT